MQREFVLAHVQVQTWFPLRMHVFVKGHDWLARKLRAVKIPYTQCDDVFVGIGDVERAQRFADRMTGLQWPAALNALARRVKVPPLDGGG